MKAKAERWREGLGCRPPFLCVHAAQNGDQGLKGCDRRNSFRVEREPGRPRVPPLIPLSHCPRGPRAASSPLHAATTSLLYLTEWEFPWHKCPGNMSSEWNERRAFQHLCKMWKSGFSFSNLLPPQRVCGSCVMFQRNHSFSKWLVRPKSLIKASIILYYTIGCLENICFSPKCIFWCFKESALVFHVLKVNLTAGSD